MDIFSSSMLSFYVYATGFSLVYGSVFESSVLK